MTASQERRFRELYAQHYAHVFAYLARRSSRQDASDAAAEVFTVVWRRVDDVPDGESALPWLYGVAAKVLGNQRRATRRRFGLIDKAKRFAPDGHAPDPAAQVVRRELDDAIVAGIQHLRRADREVLLLSTWEGLSASQLADQFGVSLSAAEKRLTRAKHRLAAQLSKDPLIASTANDEGGRT